METEPVESQSGKDAAEQKPKVPIRSDRAGRERMQHRVEAAEQDPRDQDLDDRQRIDGTTLRRT